MSVTVAQVRTSKDLKACIDLPYPIARDIPHWWPQLRFDRAHFFKSILGWTKKVHPFYLHARGELFLARRDGRPVGLIAAHFDPNHNKHYNESAGSFGFFDCQVDPEAARALFGAAEKWLRQEGATVVYGPYNPSINYEAGLLVDGFDSPPMIGNTHNPPWYVELIEAQGYTKGRDMYAWKYDFHRDAPPEAVRVAERLRKHPDLCLRSGQKSNWDEEVSRFLQIYNEAWPEANWNAVPLTEAEMKHKAAELRLILDENLYIVVDVKGEPAGICICCPNFLEAIRDNDGRLFPFGLLKMLLRLKVTGLQTGRVLVLGVRPKFQGIGLDALLYVEAHQRAQRYNYEYAELSWTLEDNYRINRGIELMGGEIYKTYRLYQKKLV